MARETRQTTGHSTPRVFHYPNVDPGPVKAKVAKPRANTKAKRTPKVAAGSKPTGVTKKSGVKKAAGAKKTGVKKASAGKGDAAVKKKAKVAEAKIEKAAQDAETKIEKAVADVTGGAKTKAPAAKKESVASKKADNGTATASTVKK